uniref:F-box domain-containing protein n=1 Tax=Oryza brachyantha TaxID=4533 RepID=J3MIG5_ORYBR
MASQRDTDGHVDQEGLSDNLNGLQGSINLDAADLGAATAVLHDEACGDVVVTSSPPVFSALAATTTTAENRHVNPVPKQLTDRVIAAILLRIPPDAPAWLFGRIPAVSKSWKRMVSELYFRKIYQDRHRKSPPLLGFFYPHKFVMTDSHRYKTGRFNQLRTVTRHTGFFRTPNSPLLPERPDWQVRDSRHGRLLMWSGDLLTVWSPLTGGVKKMVLPELWDFDDVYWQAALVCTTEGCHHLFCHYGPFGVFMVATPRDTSGGMLVAAFYSSEDDCWYESASIENLGAVLAADGQPSVLVGSSLYFPCTAGNRIIQYEIVGKEFHVMVSLTPDRPVRSVLITIDGQLGFVVIETSQTLRSWSRADDAWIAGPVISLREQPDLHVLSSNICYPVGSAVMSGVDVVLILTEEAFTLQVGEEHLREKEILVSADFKEKRWLRGRG